MSKTMIEPNLLAKNNSHPRDSHVHFEEGPHIYTVDGDDSFMSVTTWNHSHFSHFDADKIITKMMNGRNWKKSKYYGKTREEIKAGWDENGRIASEAGTKMHYDIECYYNEIYNNNSSIEFEYFLHFDDWVKANTNMLPYRTEMIVWDKELKICGSIDMLYENECGELEIYDWKRCKKIEKTSGFNKWAKTQCIDHLPDTNYWHYALQLNTYKYLIEKNYGKKVKNMYLVCLHPDNSNKNFMRFKLPHLNEEITDLMDLRKKMVEKEKEKPYFTVTDTSGNVLDTKLYYDENI